MQPNPGLSVEYNRFLTNLDATIPRRSRKNDRGAQLLYKTVQQLKDATPEVADRLAGFLKYCDGFKRSQFWVNEDHQNRHCGGCWLPVVLLGKSWPEAVNSLLRFSPPPELSAARRLIITPVAVGEASIIKVALRAEIQGVSEAGYDQFVKLVRQRFSEIESTFDPDTNQLKITGKRVIEDAKPQHGDAEHPTGGGVPAWLGLLLSMGAVDKVMFSYHLNPKEIRETKDFVRAVVVIPTCPLEWRKNDAASRTDSLRSLRDDLGVGPDDPIYMALTAVEQEWFPLVDEHIKGVLSHDALSSGSSKEALAAAADFVSDLRVRHLGRHLGLPPTLDIREDTEYRAVYAAFTTTAEPKAAWLPNPQIHVPVANLGVVIQRRLDDSAYLTAWAKWFTKLAENMANGLEPKILARTPTNGSPAAKRVSEDYVVRVNESIGDFAVYILSSVAKTLELLVSVEGDVAAAHKKSEAWHSAWTGSAEDPEIQKVANALRQVVRLIITQESQAIRSKAMAALVYFLQNDDVVPDQQPGGYADDALLISRVLMEPGVKEHIPADLVTWASSIIGKIDAVMPRSLQDRIEQKFRRFEKTIQDMATPNSPEPPAPKPKKSN